MNPVQRLSDALLRFRPGHGAEGESATDFGTHAADWWDSAGPMAPLHRLNPVRLAYLKSIICAQLGRDPAASAPLTDLTVLDIGCGGGLVTEPLARLGATVTGIDSSRELIDTAIAHAAAQDVTITYRAVLSDELVRAKKTYDVVLALEVIEHVADPDALLADIKKLLKPNGIAILSTLNRTPQSFLKGIVAAEYLVRWVPRGTHDWHAFLKPHELSERSAMAGLQSISTMGLHYDALQRQFVLRDDRLEVNYFMVLRHA